MKIKRFNEMSDNSGKAISHLEDNTGKRLFTESEINKKKDILSPDELEDFDVWIEDGNAMKRKNGKWIEQTTQWRKEFTYDELQKFFKREYLNVLQENNENNGNTRKTTPIENQVMCYLNELRESGATNMFGSTTYIIEEFPDLDKREAGRILSLWMENFNDECDYDYIEE